MPTNLTTTRDYGTAPVTIWAGDPAANRMATIDTSYIQADADGNKILLPGYPILPISDNFARIYPYSLLQTAITTSSTALVLNEARFFKVGDVVTVARPYAYLTLALTWANADTATIVFDGVNIVHTVASFSTLTALATDIAATLNANAYFSSKAQAIAENQYVHIFGKDNRNYTLTISGDGTVGNGTITASNASLQPNVSVGTITTGGIVTSTNTLTLASAASIRLPVGAPLAVSADPNKLLGITGYQYLLGSTQSELTPESNDIPAYYDGEVYRVRIPVSDRWLFDALPELIPLPRAA